MNRILCLTFGLVLLLMTSASAEVYRCRTPDGKLVMTDRQIGVPADCKPVEGPAGAGSFNVMPGDTSNGVSDDTRNGIKNPQTLPEQKAAPSVRDTASRQGQAEALVQDYKAAVQKHYNATLENDRRHAVQEIKGFRQQKQKMLNDLKGSDLTRDEHQAIQKTLNEIPQ